MEPRHRERGASLIVLVIGLLIVGLVAWLVMSRLQESREQSGAEELGATAPMDHSRQTRTIIDMQTIGRALTLMQVDTGAYPQEIAELERGGYLALVPPADAWGNAWIYESGTDGYTLTSLGAGGLPRPAPPTPWTSGAYDCDLVLTNGQITQGPSGR
jgi:hypothetical protein